MDHMMASCDFEANGHDHIRGQEQFPLLWPRAHGSGIQEVLLSPDWKMHHYRFL